MIAGLRGHRLARVTVLDCGTFSVRGGQRIIGIPAYLLTTDQGAQVLVDGGFPPAYGVDDAAAGRADGLGVFGVLVDHQPDRMVTAQLALCGVAMGDLTAHVLSHGHIDHVGALDLIACPLILTDIERSDPAPRYFGAVRPVDWPDVPTHRITDETDLCQGIRLIPTPGHTPGHLSLVLTLPDGPPIILACDALNRISEPDEGFADSADPAASARSANRLFSLQRSQVARLIYGHEPTEWPRLPKAPLPLT
ncbi:MAG: MBL fold metallo-hydrolase [Paracoccaceae bacterium]